MCTDINVFLVSGTNAMSGIFIGSSFRNSHVASFDAIIAHKSISRVVAIITGSFADISIFCILLRFLENRYIDVTVLLCNRKQYPDAVKDALLTFRRISSSREEILRLVKLNDVDGSNVDLLIEEARKLSCDLIMHSYFSSGPNGNQIREESERTRHNTISAIASSFLPAEPDLVELRKSMGVPESSLYSNLDHPELGELGERLLKLTCVPFQLIFHEPLHTASKRKQSVSKAIEGMRLNL